MSGPRKRLAVPLLQLLDRHMRVPLRSAQRRMAEHLLNLAQVRSPVQHVRRRAVPQRMRADIGHPALAGGTMHDIAHDALVEKIDAMIQREPEEGEEQADIIFLTHETRERNVAAAIEKIESHPAVKGKLTRLRLEGLL